MPTTVAPTHQARTLSVDEASDGQRLDNFLAKSCKGVPKSHLYRLIRSGQVRVNGGRAKVDRRLQLQDQVRVPPLRLPEAASRPRSDMRIRQDARQGQQIDIVHEDDDLLVINKSAGTAVHGGSGVSSGVIEQLRALRHDAPFLELVHRLDRETSGLLMVAKKRPMLRRLHEQLRRGQVQKTYVCLVAGKLPKRDRTIKKPLHSYTAADGDRRVVIDSQAGKPAITHVIGLQRVEHPGVGWLSQARVRIETGRTHQIRVHLADLGFPVLGDRKYGDFDRNRLAQRAGARRMFLHAWQLQLRHPGSGDRLTLTAPVPATFTDLMSQSAP